MDDYVRVLSPHDRDYRQGYDLPTVAPADRNAMQEAARHLLACITALHEAADRTALHYAAAEFAAGVQPLLEAAFACGDCWVLPVGGIERSVARYVAGKEDDLPDCAELRAALVALRDNADGLETEGERNARMRNGLLTREEYAWQVECEETERGLSAQAARDAALDCDWRHDP